MADNLTTFMCRLYGNLGASTSWNPQGLSRSVMGLLYIYLLEKLTVAQIYKVLQGFMEPKVTVMREI
jgi:hypothetical protein